jgi:outer membrane lipoprotein-sorting protein
MSRNLRFALLCVLISRVAPAQVAPDVQAVFDQLEQESAQNKRAFRMESETMFGIRDMAPMLAKTVLISQPPGKVRVEITQGPQEIVLFTNGTDAWMRMENRFSKIPSLPDAGRTDVTGLRRSLRSAKLLAEEEIEIDGKPVRCYVIAGEMDMNGAAGKSTHWLDKATGMMMRLVFTAQVPRPANLPADQPWSGEQGVQIRVTKMAWDVEMDAKEFEPPKDAVMESLPRR